MNPLYELSKSGGPYAIIAFLMTAISYLFKKLMESKDDQIKQAKDENEKNIIARETLQRTAENIILLLKERN